MSLDRLKALKKAKPFAQTESEGTRGLHFWKDRLIELSAPSQSSECAITLRSPRDLAPKAKATVTFFDAVVGGVVGDRLHLITDTDQDNMVHHHVFGLGEDSLAPIHDGPLAGVEAAYQIDEHGLLLARVGGAEIALFQLSDGAAAERARVSLEWKTKGSGYMSAAMRGDHVVVRGPGDHTGWKILRLGKDSLTEVGHSAGSMNQPEQLAWLSDSRFVAYGIGKKVRLFEVKDGACESLGTVDVGARYTACVSEKLELFVYADYDHRFEKGVLVDLSGSEPKKVAAIPCSTWMTHLTLKDGQAFFAADELVGVPLS